MTWTIRLAVPADSGLLPAVEQSAGERFRRFTDLAWLADEANMPAEAHRRYIDMGTEWVAADSPQGLVGFLAAQAAGQDLHIWELDVRAEMQGQEIGSAPLAAAADFAHATGCRSITLTTFASVPWNAPWYARRGFQIARNDRRLARLLALEAARGWQGRCAMRRSVDD